ncbi:hypothetical protein RU820_05155 [Acidithiobacillus ferrooxidans]|uniref:Uncharacterized protein n=1 Tax=Acidithiobacillus ferrooxidans (strain ATCC 23270 / DSM 14882 / CIP 104768 / NCIMB 8455) TaxID=243159 RepID=B7J834_ACIF2|nr:MULTISPECIES: hypothetical protein [Acidithiobacillus]ACK80944.1 hypothetical protein AFE_1086 [Acidithiobacillus ferrooxidans ATCC 23270]MBN6744953.1 hypothetical protein [Acidithiobacillus sp. MC2.2]MBN6747969.1 hypothetical protein [Acidithiobacillus sp. PG05]
MCGVLINISGKTNSGKTTLALTIAKNAARSGLLLTIFDDADRVGETLNPLVERLLEQGTHVVTITHGASDQPVVSIAGQPGDFLMRALFGDALAPGNRVKFSGEKAVYTQMNTTFSAALLDAIQTGKSYTNPILEQKILEIQEIERVVYSRILEAARMGEVKLIVNTLLSSQELTLLFSTGEHASVKITDAQHADIIGDTDGLGLMSLVRQRLEMAGLNVKTLEKKGSLRVSWEGFEKRQMNDPYLAFARDLHELLLKHSGIVNRDAARSDGVQIAVTPEVAEMLCHYDGASGYLNNLRRFDSNQRT